MVEGGQAGLSVFATLQQLEQPRIKYRHKFELGITLVIEKGVLLSINAGTDIIVNSNGDIDTIACAANMLGGYFHRSSTLHLPVQELST